MSDQGLRRRSRSIARNPFKTLIQLGLADLTANAGKDHALRVQKRGIGDRISEMESGKICRRGARPDREGDFEFLEERGDILLCLAIVERSTDKDHALRPP